METHVIYVKSDSVEEANHRIDQCLDYVLDNLIHADSAPRERMKNNLEKVHAVQITLGDRDDHDLFVLVNRRDLGDGERDGTPASTLIARKITAEDADNIVMPSIHEETINGIETIVEAGANVHFAGTGLTVHRTDSGLNPVLRRSLRRLTGDRTDAAAIIDGIPHSGGRPPIGCRVESGVLRPGDDYYRVCESLQAVADGELGKTDAASKLGCARKTIDNALQRPELYQLD